MRISGGDARQLGERGPPGPRVGDDEVAEAVLVQPQRLRQGQVEQPLKTRGAVQHPAKQRPAANRLARDPDRLSARAGEHLIRVGGDRVEVDERERRLELREDRLVALVHETIPARARVLRLRHMLDTNQATLKEVVETLAPLERRAGSEAERLAAEWIAERIERAGTPARVEEEQFYDGYARELLPLGVAGFVASALASAAAGEHWPQ